MMDEAIEALEDALQTLKDLRASGFYSIAEMREVRTKILQAVRDGIDPFVGHMPDKRHY